ncbi:caspase family protein [Taklimakanibacter lacteus]|uniref:caspase family protein n=1 Tax=Taklimakanibacter lacteus TaxID=2268456 RepID=UPI000E65FE2C
MTWLTRLLGFFSLGFMALATSAQELPKEPMLRIDGGMHTASIRRLDVSADGKILVTGSEDKTVRVWSLPEGRLLKTLRLPAAPGDIGKVFATAISPDGKLVAAGGWDDVDNTALDYYVYIFDRVTGHILGRLGPHPQVIDELTFSPDGKRLAVGMGGSAGIAVWDTAQWNRILTDGEYGDQVNGIAFSSAGEMAVTSHDRGLRLYGADLNLKGSIHAPSNDRTEGVAFSPDGSKLLVGYVGTMAVDILDARSLQRLYQADTSGLAIGDLAAVGWSDDGQTIFAAGDYYTQGGVERMQMFAWDKEGQGKRRAHDAAGNTVMDLKALPGGGAAIADANGGFTVYDAKGDIVLRKTSIAADLRGELGENFTVSEDGMRVRFGLGIEGQDPWLFDMATLRFTEAPQPPGDLKPANVTKLDVRNWQDEFEPTVSGAPLQLDRNERSRSLAIEEDGETLVLGTNWSLRRYTKKSTPLWSLAVPSIPWGLNITARDQLLIAAHTDGTIRWYRLADGAELLALFVDATDKRWIAWTPTGYYAASPGGEDLIGWHVNRGFDQAPDFFPASQFHDQFYRPDIVREVFNTYDEDQAIKNANAKAKRPPRKEEITDILPPVIEIVKPAEGTSVTEAVVTLSYRVRTPDGEPADEIEVLIDGRPQGQRGAAVVNEDDSLSLDVTIPARDVEVALIARQGDAVSVPARVTLKWAGPPSEDQIKRKLYAVFVGVSDYDKAGLKLNFADDDARDFSASEAAQQGSLYEAVEVKLLTDKEASADNIRSALGWLEDKVGPEDVGMLFLAGHGVTDAKQRFYFLPVGGDPEDLRSTAIGESEIREAISSLAGKVLFFIDACHSADSLKGDVAQADVTAVVNRMARADAGVIMFASSGGNELSLERADWNNGAFTETLLAGLAGAADYEKDGSISTAELNLWLTTQVKKLTGNRQNAVMLKPDTVPDFPVARVK